MGSSGEAYRGGLPVASNEKLIGGSDFEVVFVGLASEIDRVPRLG